jgi:hypothetical protein
MRATVNPSIKVLDLRERIRHNATEIKARLESGLLGSTGEIRMGSKGHPLVSRISLVGAPEPHAGISGASKEAEPKDFPE